jgi:hypothetical protein
MSWAAWTPPAITNRETGTVKAIINGKVVVTVKAIAKKIGMSESAVYWRLRRGQELTKGRQSMVQKFGNRDLPSTGYHGVYKVRGGYFARIAYRGKRYYLGWYKTAGAAADAYDTKAVELLGEKAIINESHRVKPEQLPVRSRRGCPRMRRPPLREP